MRTRPNFRASVRVLSRRVDIGSWWHPAQNRLAAKLCRTRRRGTTESGYARLPRSRALPFPRWCGKLRHFAHVLQLLERIDRRIYPRDADSAARAARS